MNNYPICNSTLIRSDESEISTLKFGKQITSNNFLQGKGQIMKRGFSAVVFAFYG